MPLTSTNHMQTIPVTSQPLFLALLPVKLYMFTRRLQISMFWKHDLTLFTQKAETEALGKDKKVR